MNKKELTSVISEEESLKDTPLEETPQVIFLQGGQTTSLKKQNKRALSNLVKKLLALRDQGRLTDEELSEIIAYVCSMYVEKEVEKHFSKVFNRQMSLFLPF